MIGPLGRRRAWLGRFPGLQGRAGGTARSWDRTAGRPAGCADHFVNPPGSKPAAEVANTTMRIPCRQFPFCIERRASRNRSEWEGEFTLKKWGNTDALDLQSDLTGYPESRTMTTVVECSLQPKRGAQPVPRLPVRAARRVQAASAPGKFLDLANSWTRASRLKFRTNESLIGGTDGSLGPALVRPRNAARPNGGDCLREVSRLPWDAA